MGNGLIDRWDDGVRFNQRHVMGVEKQSQAGLSRVKLWLNEAHLHKHVCLIGAAYSLL